MKKNVILTVMLAMAFMACARPAVDVDSLARTQRVVLDISRYQGEDINFEKVKQSSVKWLYIKCCEGFRLDPQFFINAKGAKDAKIHIGAYCFFSEKSGALDQAMFFINNIKAAGIDFTLIPMVDAEKRSIYTCAQYCDSLQVLLDCLEAEFKCKPLIYSGERFFLDNLISFGNSYPLWIAKYSNTAPDLGNIGYDYVLWQRSEEGMVNGINSLVCFSTFHGSHRPRDIKLPSSSQDDEKNTPKFSKKDKKKGKGDRK